jgi:hypothetical protein
LEQPQSTDLLELSLGSPILVVFRCYLEKSAFVVVAQVGDEQVEVVEHPTQWALACSLSRIENWTNPPRSLAVAADEAVPRHHPI